MSTGGVVFTSFAPLFTIPARHVAVVGNRAGLTVCYGSAAISNCALPTSKTVATCARHPKFCCVITTDPISPDRVRNYVSAKNMLFSPFMFCLSFKKIYICICFNLNVYYVLLWQFTTYIDLSFWLSEWQLYYTHHLSIGFSHLYTILLLLSKYSNTNFSSFKAPTLLFQLKYHTI